mgnify:CR=1 FL=1
MLTLLIVDREGNQREEPGSRANTKLWRYLEVEKSSLELEQILTPASCQDLKQNLSEIKALN